MRRQTEILEDVVPVRVQKLDPARLSLSFGNPVESAGSDERSVEAERVALARRIGDAAAKIALPLNAYRGVAIRVVPGMTEEEDRVAIVLSHADATLEVPLYEADDDSDVIAEWRLWGSTLGLPLLMEGFDGRTVAAETKLGEVGVDRPRPRRRYALLAGRRPRFLTRRRTGKPSLVPFVHFGEREIIAPE